MAVSCLLIHQDKFIRLKSSVNAVIARITLYVDLKIRT